MRALVLIFGLIGAGGAAFAGFAGKEGLKKSEAQKGAPEGTEVKKKLEALNMSIYSLIGAGVVGLVATFVAFGRNGKLAAVLFLAAYAIPLCIATFGVGVKPQDDLFKVFAFFPAGLVIAGVLSLLIAPKMAHSRVRQAEARDD